ncbi:MAG: hypothetical protein LBQ33_06780 [Oscillospiraceae bacterium]|jgi:hypothetical protein|nr:hypothetical protein [Oscillospiraceae bacterium]
MKSKNRRVKRGLSILTAAALLFGTLFTGVRAQAETCSCKEIPRIGLHGINEPMLLNAGTPEEKEVVIVDASALQDAILPMAEKIICAAATQSWDAGADALAIFANSLFGLVKCDENGDSIAPITNEPRLDPQQDHKQNHDYNFEYDWRLDPMESARKLDAFIKQVQRQTGHEKVVLQPHSEGGLVVSAYLAQFGSGALEHIIPLMCAFNGLTMVGDLFNRRVSLSAKGLSDYLSALLGEEGEMGVLTAAVEVLHQAGLLLPVVNALQLLIDNVGDRLYQEALIPIFGQMPALWGFVPDKDYESAKASMLDGSKHAKLIEKLDDYHYNAGAKTVALLRQAEESGTKVSIIATYGFPGMPVSPGAVNLTDGLIDTALESCGATTARYGEALPEDYVQKVDDGHSHISPDRMVDASTCAFPEQTWFITGQTHFSFGVGALQDYLVYSEKQPTVHGSRAFPQFLARQAEDTLVPAQTPAATAQVTLLSSIFTLMRRVIVLLVEMVAG